MSQLSITCSAAKRRFTRQPIKIWVAMVGTDAWRAFVINTELKIQVCTGPLAPSYKEALQSLTEKISAGGVRINI